MKKTLATLTMALVLGSTVFANGGIIIAGKDSGTRSTKATRCTDDKEGIIIAGKDGIIIAGRGTMFGEILAALDGILVSDRNSRQTEGILVSDREGILVSD